MKKEEGKKGNSLSPPVTFAQLGARRKVMPALEDTRGSSKKTVKCNMRARYECWLLKNAASVFLRISLSTTGTQSTEAVRRRQVHAPDDRKQRLSLV